MQRFFLISVLSLKYVLHTPTEHHSELFSECDDLSLLSNLNKTAPTANPTTKYFTLYNIYINT